MRLLDGASPLIWKPDADAVRALAPLGTLRAGINVANSLLVSNTGLARAPVGVSPSIAARVAASLGVPLELVPFASPTELADAVTADRWDIGNIGADPARAEHIVFTAPYCEIDSTYLVRPGARIVTIADVDHSGIRIATRAGAAYTLWLERNIKRAELVQCESDSFEVFVDQELDVVAGIRPRLLGDAKRLPGARVLDERFMAVQQAIGIPRDRNVAALEYLERFVATAIRSGLVATLIERHGTTGLSVPRGSGES